MVNAGAASICSVLPTAHLLHDTAVAELTGLRNPCVQRDRFQSGLMAGGASDEHGKPRLASRALP